MTQVPQALKALQVLMVIKAKREQLGQLVTLGRVELLGIMDLQETLVIKAIVAGMVCQVNQAKKDP